MIISSSSITENYSRQDLIFSRLKFAHTGLTAYSLWKDTFRYVKCTTCSCKKTVEPLLVIGGSTRDRLKNRVEQVLGGNGALGPVGDWRQTARAKRGNTVYNYLKEAVLIFRI